MSQEDVAALETLYRLGAEEARAVLEGAYRLGAKPAPIPVEGGSGEFWVELAGVRLAHIKPGTGSGFISFSWAGVFEDLSGARANKGRETWRNWTWEQAEREIQAAIEHRFKINVR